MYERVQAYNLIGFMEVDGNWQYTDCEEISNVNGVNVVYALKGDKLKIIFESSDSGEAFKRVKRMIKRHFILRVTKSGYVHALSED